MDSDRPCKSYRHYPTASSQVRTSEKRRQIKRVYFEHGTVRLRPESYDPEYRDRVIDESDPDAPSAPAVLCPKSTPAVCSGA